MPRPRKDAENSEGTKRPPARTPQQLENQLISLAYEKVEERIREGKASSQELVHFLKLGSSTERLQQEKMILEQQLLKARAEQIVSNEKNGELLERAMRAFAGYRGEEVEEDFLD